MRRPSWLQHPTPVDAVAGLIALTALAGVVWSPKLTNAVARATGSIQPVQISVDVRNLPMADPEGFLQSIRDEGRLSFVIRNQPAGSVRVLSAQNISPKLVSVMPDGSVIQADNPSAAALLYARFDLEADAEKGESGVVIGGTKLKIGVPVELEGNMYRVNGVVSGVAQS
ncbi:DUF4330 domain-containing protein [Synechococcus sp. CC9616]|uniref:DUF4330 domain-containing protein n=1 Tax=Synechococcus sp. CC9616 TaxID=110663 RepID=UPI00048FA47C|nr:DUF4330 domain-containing protein [Synechococcus sp. CC9616]